VHNAPPVNETMSKYPEVFNNENVARANEVIGRVAEEKGLTVIDVYSLFAGEDGGLPAEATWDGIHLNGSLYEVWADFLRSAVA
jgi:lysophospholipase L1-like esterase